MNRLCGTVAVALADAIGGAAKAESGGALSAPDDPHAFFPLSTTDTLERIVRGCASHDDPVWARGPGEVTCEVQMGVAERIAARVVLREPFARSPRAFLRFTVEPGGPGFTRANVSGSVEDQRPAPHRRVQSLAGLRFAQHAQGLLKDFGGSPRPL